MRGTDGGIAVNRLIAAALERAPAQWDEAFGLGRRYVMPLLRPMLAAHRLTGRDSSARPATIVAVGSQSTLDVLLARFFHVPPRRDEIGRVALPGLRSWLSHGRNPADLQLAVVPRAYLGGLGREHLRVPTLIGFDQRVEHTVAATLIGASESVRQYARKVRELGYGWHMSTDMREFERFYAMFYRPFAHARFGSLAVIREPGVLRRHFRHGGAIVWVHRDGHTVAGELVRRQGRSLERLVQGLAGDGVPPSKGPSPQVAIGVACTELAVGAGLDRIGYGGAVPSLRDGVLRAKRAWGTAAHLLDTNHRTLLVGWAEFGPVQKSFLHSNPLIFEAGGSLAAVAAPAPGEAADLAAARLIWRRLVPQGVQRLFLLGAASWARHVTADRRGPPGSIVLCPPCSSADLVAAAAEVV